MEIDANDLAKRLAIRVGELEYQVQVLQIMLDRYQQPTEQAPVGTDNEV